MFKTMAAVTAGAALLLGAAAADAAITKIDMSSYVNSSWAGEFFSGVPTGDNVVLGGTAFDIQAAGDHAAYRLFDSTPLTITTSMYGVTEVYTLLNTLWGEAGTNKLSVTFNATGGVTQTFQLVGDVDIRDYLQNTYTNAINGTTTQNVFNNGARRLDRQTFSLDAAFATQTLTSIVFTDTGATGVQRGALTAVTLSGGVPEPASWAMMIVGFGAAGGMIRLRKAVLA